MPIMRGSNETVSLNCLAVLFFLRVHRLLRHWSRTEKWCTKPFFVRIELDHVACTMQIRLGNAYHWMYTHLVLLTIDTWWAPFRSDSRLLLSTWKLLSWKTQSNYFLQLRKPTDCRIRNEQNLKEKFGNKLDVGEHRFSSLGECTKKVSLSHDKLNAALDRHFTTISLGYVRKRCVSSTYDKQLLKFLNGFLYPEPALKIISPMWYFFLSRDKPKRCEKYFRTVPVNLGGTSRSIYGFLVVNSITK